MRGLQVRRAVVVREPRATFSLAPGGPPRPAARTPLRGLFLAGDWTDTGLPGTIEGAVIGDDTGAEGCRDGLDGGPIRAGQFAGDTVCIDDSGTKPQEEARDCAFSAADPTR
jgi:hypothetical protein